MKTKLFLTLLAVSAAWLGTMQAQTTAFSDPVGYISVDIGAGPNQYSVIAPTLVNKTEFAGLVANASGTEINLNTTNDPSPLGSNDYGYNAGAGERPKYFVETRSGNDEGTWTHIESNTGSQITTSQDISGALSGGGTVVIRKHVTVADFFGPANEQGLQPGFNSFFADNIILLTGGALVPTTVFYSSLSSDWIDSDTGFSAADYPIPLNQGVLVLRRGGTALDFTFTGHVKTTPTRVAVEQGFNYVQVVHPVGEDDNTNPVFTLGNSGLYTGLPGDGLSAGFSSFFADNVIDITTGETYFYSSLSSAWLNSSGQNSDNYVLSEGTGLLINRRSTATNWKTPAPTINQ